MPRGRPLAYRPILTPEERHTLETWTTLATVSDAEAAHGALVLLVAQGATITAAASRVGLSRLHATKWLMRWRAGGLGAMRDRRRDRVPKSARWAYAAEDAAMEGWTQEQDYLSSASRGKSTPSG